jgi:two-component sensor histidine kinase
MAGGREGSLGYGLVETLVRQIGGDMTVQERPGVTVTIVFPCPEPAEGPPPR